MLILLPPSEGKTSPRRGAPLDLKRLSSPQLTTAREWLLSSLTEVSASDPVRAAQALGLGPTQAGLVSANAALGQAPTARADRVYSGVLYDALDPPTLAPAAKRRLASRVGIASALFGLLRPTDRIPAYRLSADTVLSRAGLPSSELPGGGSSGVGSPGVGSVAQFWREHLGSAMEEAVGAGLFVDLRSTAYATFWRSPQPQRTATVRVLHEHQGRRKVVSHFNKATKGRLVRALLEDGSRPRTPTELAAVWQDLGWTVETGVSDRAGTRLDVVVSEV